MQVVLITVRFDGVVDGVVFSCLPLYLNTRTPVYLVTLTDRLLCLHAMHHDITIVTLSLHLVRLNISFGGFLIKFITILVIFYEWLYVDLEYVKTRSR